MNIDHFRASFLSLGFLFFPAADVHATDWLTRDIELAPYKGAFAEFCVAVSQGIVLEIELESTQVIDFNVHFHAEQETLFPVRERVNEKAAFQVPATVAGEYCLMWENPEQRTKTTAVRTRYRLR